MHRRGFLTLLAATGAAPLAGCGFKPVYATSGDGSAGPAERGLAEVNVELIPERSGQLLRLALQNRFYRSGTQGLARRYDLSVSYSIAGDALGISQTDSSASRLRLIGSANWRLIAQDPQRTTLTNGFARSVDGQNLFNQQFFAQDLETEAVQRRMAEEIADQIALQLATWFNRRG